MPEQLEATFRIVTPMFLGGANQDVSDGIRPPSVKGALRFWWRALNWARFARVATCDESALILLHDEEVRLFGGAAEQGGQGRFFLSITENPWPRPAISNWPTNGSGAGYLAFGIIESGSPAKGTYRPHRQAIAEARTFRIRFIFRPGTEAVDKESITECLSAWALFGGLGSRARRGMGSITMVGENGAYPGLQEFRRDATALINACSDVKPAPYTAFCSTTRLRILTPGKDARQVLGNLGQDYKAFRGQASELHGAAKIPFGLPLQRVDEAARRASPLFFHVHALAGEQFVASVLYLPAATFHPQYPNVSFAKVVDFAGDSPL